MFTAQVLQKAVLSCTRGSALQDLRNYIGTHVRHMQHHDDIFDICAECAGRQAETVNEKQVGLACGKPGCTGRCRVRHAISTLPRNDWHRSHTTKPGRRDMRIAGRRSLRNRPKAILASRTLGIAIIQEAASPPEIISRTRHRNTAGIIWWMIIWLVGFMDQAFLS